MWPHSFHHLNLRVAGGELLVIVGPSGCGKTAVLRLIAGLERPTEGSICLDGQRVNDWPPGRRNLALVADHGILFPQHSVRENLAWSLRARRGGRRWWLGGGAAKGLAETEINRRVEQVAERLGVTPFLGRRPEELSAGQQQRVALGRALLVEPRVFLLDEPLARLDGVLRVSLARELKQWLAQSGTTSVYVPGGGDVVEAGRGRWQVVETGGHCRGHLCLYDAARRLLISGDQVLPTISPNVSVLSSAPDADPLREFLASIQRLRACAPDTLVLPSHGRPFRGLHARLDDLEDHHHQQLEALRAFCAEPRTAFEVLPSMFRRVPRGFHRLLAVGEAVAHLNYLCRRGDLERHVDATGIARFVAR